MKKTYIPCAEIKKMGLTIPEKCQTATMFGEDMVELRDLMMSFYEAGDRAGDIQKRILREKKLTGCAFVAISKYGYTGVGYINGVRHAGRENVSPLGVTGYSYVPTVEKDDRIENVM